MTKILLPEKYPYFYETHMHTSSGSACGECTGKEMAAAYKDAGYAGIFITDHNWGGNTAVSRKLPWAEWTERFCEGYEEAAEWGRRNELSVFWGYEAGYDATEFLIYGLTPAFFKAHPEIREASVAEQYQMVKEAGGMVIHAHPYREAFYIPEIRLFPQYVDGVEGWNATHHNRFYQGNKAFNDRAAAYAKEQGLPLTAGSDMHHTRLPGGGMAFPEKLEDGKDFCQRVLSKTQDYLLTDGVTWYSRWGEAVDDVKWSR